VPLLLRVKAQDLDLGSLLELQRALQDYTKLLSKKGAAYQIKPEYLCPIKMAHGHWKLYLGGWMEADFSSDESQAQSEEWQKREEVQLSEITQIFAKACATIQAQTQ
jgi:nucleoside-specific outer membrane channel protein Tsx